MFLEFILEQYILVAALLFSVFLLFKHESRKGGAAISPQQLASLVNQENAVVLDIREGKDFRAGHITESLHIPLNEFQSRLSELNDYKQKPIVVVCKMGQSSGTVGKQLRAAGFEQVFKLSGGISEWQASSMRLVK